MASLKIIGYSNLNVVSKTFKDFNPMSEGFQNGRIIGDTNTTGGGLFMAAQ